MSDKVEQLHKFVYERFEATPWFDDIVLIRGEDAAGDPDDMAQRLKTVKSRGGKKGAAIVVDQPFRDVDAGDIPGPEWVVRIPIGIYEARITNRGDGGTGKNIQEIISRAAALTHHFYIDPLGTQVTCAREAVTPIWNKGILTAELIFGAAVNQPPEEKVSAPKVKGTADAVEIIPAARYGVTVGAFVYYTTNGTTPRPGGEGSTLLGTVLLTEEGDPILSESGDPLLAEPVATFAVAPGTLVLAAAYKDGMQPSDLGGKQF